MTMLSYLELSKLKTFKERFLYLKQASIIGEQTFGFSRYLNQVFYKSAEWRRLRRSIILRDDGCDLGLEDYPIKGYVYIHHLNPITPKDILESRPCVFDRNNLICSSLSTHNLLHFGGDSDIPDRAPIIRQPNDTTPWKS